MYIEVDSSEPSTTNSPYLCSLCDAGVHEDPANVHRSR